MKLRIRGNAVRVRVTRGELGRLAEDGCLIEESQIGNATLRYGLRVDPGSDLINASYENNSLIVMLPAQMVNEWTTTDLVTLTGEQALPGDDMLTVVVEKDFACLTPRAGDDDEDTFAHPMADTGASC